jgi:hypothetical protein
MHLENKIKGNTNGPCGNLALHRGVNYFTFKR